MLASELSFHHLATKQDMKDLDYRFEIKLKDMEQRLTL